MNYCVPVFEMEEEDSNPTSSEISRQKKSTLHEEEELMELLWQNGQAVMQSQNQRSLKNSSSKYPTEDAVIPGRRSMAEEIRPSAAAEEEAAHQLFMQEDEMASWLHYPLDDSFDRDFCSDLLDPSPSDNFTSSSRFSQIPEDRRPEKKNLPDPRPATPPARHTELDSPTNFSHFLHFSRPKVRSESRPSVLDKTARESTAVGSREMPAVGPGSGVSHGARSTTPVSARNLEYGSTSGGGDGANADVVSELVTCEQTTTSSSGRSGHRKRKAREADDNECHSEDVEFESVDAKKQVYGSSSSRRARAIEVHNLSERKRRDRINEKMKALQELLPQCNKLDKASMLDEAIEYLKSLQLQVQMMSMGCGMVPMMFPGVQQYMSPMGMGMGMGVGMDMAMRRLMLPFPSVLAGSAMPTPPSAAHLGLTLPIPALQLPQVSTPDLSIMQATNQSAPAMNSIGMQSPNHLRVQTFANPYQHYLGLHPMQVPPPPQSHTTSQPSTSKGVDRHQSG